MRTVYCLPLATNFSRKLLLLGGDTNRNHKNYCYSAVLVYCVHIRNSVLKSLLQQMGSSLSDDTQNAMK